MGADRARLIAAALGGAAMVGAAFVPWVARGPGSSLRGHEMVDAVVALQDDIHLSATRGAVVWYVVPALGAASWVAIGLGAVHSRTSRAVALAALAAAVGAWLVFRRLVGPTHLDVGPLLAVGGACLLMLAAWAPRPRRPDPSGPPLPD